MEPSDTWLSGWMRTKCCQRNDARLTPSSGKVEAIKVHHFVPGRHKVTHERLLRVAARIDFREGSELGVGTEDQINDGARPLELARRPIAPLQHAFRCGGLLPLRVHVEQVDE